MKVSERGSFTVGAAAARVPQSVASRRVAALEAHFGERLFDRRSRGATLTPFGRDMLPSARRLVQLAEAVEYDAERAKLRPMRLAVPDLCTASDLAQLAADAREQGLSLDLCAAPPAERAELVRGLEVRVALVAVPPSEAFWSVPLGLAGMAEPRSDTIYLESLRAGRYDTGAKRRVWIQPEDDVPHVRDRLTRVRDAAGLAPAQVTVASSLVAAAAEALASMDLLLCSPQQAVELGLFWRPIGEVRLARGFDLAADAPSDAERIRTRLSTALARCLGATPRDDTEAVDYAGAVDDVHDRAGAVAQ